MFNKMGLNLVAGLLVGLSAAVGFGANAPPAQGFSGEIEPMLDRALPNPGQTDGSDPMLWLEADRGQWKRIWGKGYAVFEHPGLVEAAEVAADTVRLKVRMLINGDIWVKGTWVAVYDIVLDRRADGSVVGRYEGEFRGQRVEGEVTGRVHPPRPVREGFVPVRPGEHPRLLFRKTDIPRLQEKLRTPFGQAYLEAAEASGDAVSMGVLYQLTGDRTYADRARQAAEVWFQGDGDDTTRGYGFVKYSTGGLWSADLAYDLCLGAWPETFNTRVRTRLAEFVEKQQHFLNAAYANCHPCSNYYAPGRAIPGVVSMILWGDKAEAPPKEPQDLIARAWKVAPPKDYRPGAGVPVETFVLGQTPARWIWTGRLPYEVSRDLLAKLGGYEAARPDLATTALYIVKSGTWFKQVDLAFKLLLEGLASWAGLDLGKASPDGAGSVSVYFTNLRVGGEHLLRRMPARKGVRVFLSGVEIGDDKLYRVQPGVHPMTVDARVEKTAGLVPVTLVEADPQADTGPVGVYRIAHALWTEDRALWERTGMDPQCRVWLDRGWFQNFQHYRWGIGDGGFLAETGGYAGSSWFPSVYASVYRNFFGRAVSPYPDVDHLIPRYIMQHVFVPGGNPVHTKLNSVVPLDPGWLACHFPILPERYKPAALWVWNYLVGATGDASTQDVVIRSKRRRGGHQPGLALAQTFINYPLGLKPVPPSESMPLSWRADTFGFYVWRSGWEGGPEFVTQVFAKAAPIYGWNHPNAASFTLRGLGHDWTTAPTSRNGVREQYSVVLLPDDDTNQGSCGRVTHDQARPDGSGALTIDMSDVYSAGTPRIYDKMLWRHPERLKPSGITGLRAFGFDYSGTSGAPALVAIVDRMAGGGRRLWTWQRPEKAAVEVHRNGFTLRQGDATLRATFVAPANVQIEAPGREAIQVGDPRRGFHGFVDRIKVVPAPEGGSGPTKAAGTGGAADTVFFVVLTVQRGDPPAVEVEGEGLGAKVTVGGQTVRFDGEKMEVGR